MNAGGGAAGAQQQAVNAGGERLRRGGSGAGVQQQAVDAGGEREPGVEVGAEDGHVGHGRAHLLREHGAPALRQVLVHADDVQAVVGERRREARHLRAAGAPARGRRCSGAAGAAWERRFVTARPRRASCGPAEAGEARRVYTYWPRARQCTATTQATCTSLDLSSMSALPCVK